MTQRVRKHSTAAAPCKEPCQTTETVTLEAVSTSYPNWLPKRRQKSKKLLWSTITASVMTILVPMKQVEMSRVPNSKRSARYSRFV